MRCKSGGGGKEQEEDTAIDMSVWGEERGNNHSIGHTSGVEVGGDEGRNRNSRYHEKDCDHLVIE